MVWGSPGTISNISPRLVLAAATAANNNHAILFFFPSSCSLLSFFRHSLNSQCSEEDGFRHVEVEADLGIASMIDVPHKYDALPTKFTLPRIIHL